MFLNFSKSFFLSLNYRIFFSIFIFVSKLLKKLFTNKLGSLNDNMRLRSKALNVITHSCYLSQFELKKVDEALQDADWVNSMHKELHQFVRNDVWELVPRPKGVKCDWN